jgi:hypothetical protein
MSGEERGGVRRSAFAFAFAFAFVGARLAREGGLPADLFLPVTHQFTVGVSLLAMALAHSISIWLTYCYREQAHSYWGFCCVGSR